MSPVPFALSLSPSLFLSQPMRKSDDSCKQQAMREAGGEMTSGFLFYKMHTNKAEAAFDDLKKHAHGEHSSSWYKSNRSKEKN